MNNKNNTMKLKITLSIIATLIIAVVPGLIYFISGFESLSVYMQFLIFALCTVWGFIMSFNIISEMIDYLKIGG